MCRLTLRALPEQYAQWKQWLKEKGYESVLRTTTEPVSPPNDRVTAWGKMGVNSGLADYEIREKVKATAKSSTWGIKFAVMYSIVTRYLPALKTCTVSIG